MDDLRFGALIRASRIHRSWRQRDLAEAAGVSRGTVVRLELGRVDEMSVRALRRVAHALEIRVELAPRSRGAHVERVASARHSALAERVTAWIRGLPGWIVKPEVSFSIWGERGLVDLVAWHAATRTLLIIELKTAIVDVGEILGTLDRKVRLAAQIVTELGWRPATVSVCLIVGDGRTNRRRVAEHVQTFRAALPSDGRQLRAWLRRPDRAIRVLTFLSDERRGDVRSGFATVSRVSAGRRRLAMGNLRSARGRETQLAAPEGASTQRLRS